MAVEPRPSQNAYWKDGRVAYCDALEKHWAARHRSVGSNPTLSSIHEVNYEAVSKD